MPFCLAMRLASADVFVDLTHDEVFVVAVQAGYHGVVELHSTLIDEPFALLLIAQRKPREVTAMRSERADFDWDWREGSSCAIRFTIVPPQRARAGRNLVRPGEPCHVAEVISARTDEATHKP